MNWEDDRDEAYPDWMEAAKLRDAGLDTGITWRGVLKAIVALLMGIGAAVLWLWR